MLHTHSEFSFIDGRARTMEIAEQAKANGREYIAITDHDEVGGHLDFQKSCKAVGIKPVYGTEARWLRSIAASREDKTRGYDSSHICLLAENNIGLRNMWSLSSLAYEPENFYNKPQLEPGLLREYSEGLWASDGCGLTRFAGYAEDGNLDGARQEWSILLDIFGDRFYSELHTFNILEPVTEKDHELNKKITLMNQMKLSLAKEMGVPLVVVNDSHYAQKHQWEEHRLTWNLSTGAYAKDKVEAKGQAADWMMNDEELIYYMGLHCVPRSVTQEAIKNSDWIASKCNVEIKPTLEMPRLYPTDAEDAKAFRQSIERGYQRFITDKGLDSDIYRQRLEYEAKLIIDKGMAGYFNGVADYVLAARDGSWATWVDPRAKRDACLCGPGRGSGGGSLVNYVMGITSLDPIKYDLMFERFINPDRPDYPDIDVDFEKRKKAGIKAYLGKRYGDGAVCSIGTRARSGPKQMFKDLWRALYKNDNYQDMLAIVNLISEVDTIDWSNVDEDEVDDDVEVPGWDEVLQQLDTELAPWAQKYPDIFRFLENMVRLVRQAGVHAAGVVVNTKPLLGRAPTRYNHKKGVRSTQFDMHEIEELGGVKNDILANKGLDVLAIARGLVYERHRVWLDYDGFGFGIPEDCPPENVITFGDEHYNDPAIWEQIDRGETAGIFQIGTPGGTKQAIRFKPRGLVDLANLVAINRPGVIGAGQLEPYLARRLGTEPTIYDHPLMEPITGPSSSMYTYGILVYQEQLIRAAREIAGFTAGEAESLRKAIGKKLVDKIAEIKPKFLDGCMANPEFTRRGGTKGTALKIWSSLEAAGLYAFNKAHSTGYAMQPCWEIWTKHYYFDEFVTAGLSVHGESKLQEFLRECRRRNRPILLPDINTSGSGFTLTDDGIRYGITDIRGVGAASINDIIKNRPYQSITDFLSRTSKSGGRKKGVVDALIKAGAFDSFEFPYNISREEMLEEVYYLRAAEEVSPNKWERLSVDERNVIVSEKLKKNPELYPRFDFSDEKFLFELENELLGTNVSVDPMAKYAKMIDGECIKSASDINNIDIGDRFTIGGELVKVRKHTQKNGKQMAFLGVRWNGEDFDICAFNDAWEANKAMLSETGVPIALDVIKLKGNGCSLSVAVRLDWMLNDKGR